MAASGADKLSAIVCALCLAIQLSIHLLSFSFTIIYFVADHIILSFHVIFFLQGNRVEHLKPRILYIISHSPLLFSSGPKMGIWFVTRWVEQFYRVCLFSASCRFMSVPLKYCLIMSVFYWQQFLSISNLLQSFASLSKLSIREHIPAFSSVRWLNRCIYSRLQVCDQIHQCVLTCCPSTIFLISYQITLSWKQNLLEFVNWRTAIKAARMSLQSRMNRSRQTRL